MLSPSPATTLAAPRLGAQLHQHAAELAALATPGRSATSRCASATPRLTQRLGDADADGEAERRQAGRRLGERPRDREGQARAERREPRATAAAAARLLQFGEYHPRPAGCRRSRRRIQLGVGGVRSRTGPRSRSAARQPRAPSAPRMRRASSSSTGLRQPIAAARQALDRHAALRAARRPASTPRRG